MSSSPNGLDLIHPPIFLMVREVSLPFPGSSPHAATVQAELVAWCQWGVQAPHSPHQPVHQALEKGPWIGTLQPPWAWLRIYLGLSAVSATHLRGRISEGPS